jgi:hypothetical protein
MPIRQHANQPPFGQVRLHVTLHEVSQTKGRLQQRPSAVEDKLAVNPHVRA